jgi:hypothetical protein
MTREHEAKSGPRGREIKHHWTGLTKQRVNGQWRIKECTHEHKSKRQAQRCALRLAALENQNFSRRDLDDAEGQIRFA